MKKLLEKVDNKYVRLIAFIIVVINASLDMFNIQALPFSNTEIVSGISVVGIVVIGAWNFWKNNSFTEMAKQSDNWLSGMKKQLKANRKKFKKDDANG